LDTYFNKSHAYEHGAYPINYKGGNSLP
jgi:hypothetical protein